MVASGIISYDVNKCGEIVSVTKTLLNLKKTVTNVVNCYIYHKHCAIHISYSFYVS